MRGTWHVWDDAEKGAGSGKFKVLVTFPDGKEQRHYLYAFNRKDAVDVVDDYNRRSTDGTLYRLVG